MSAPKLVRAAQTAVFNQFMTREAISSVSFTPAGSKMMAEQSQIHSKIRLHDESTHLKFGFPKTENVPISIHDDYIIQLNAEKLVKEEKDRQNAFWKLSNLSL